MVDGLLADFDLKKVHQILVIIREHAWSPPMDLSNRITSAERVWLLEHAKQLILERDRGQ